MEIEKHLAELAQADPQARRTALENVLAAEGLTSEIQECEADESRKAARNYLLYTADKDAKGPLFCAHYDAHPGSTGANDNAAAVCILIALAKELQQRKIPATIAFFDGEESGHSGAKLFEDGRKREVSCVVNLDIAMINKFYDLATMQPEVPATVQSHYELLEHKASECTPAAARTAPVRGPSAPRSGWTPTTANWSSICRRVTTFVSPPAASRWSALPLCPGGTPST